VTTVIGDLSYDYLVLATGTKSNYFGNEQIKHLSFPMKRIPHALDLRSQLLQALEQASMTTDETYRQSLLNFVIAGAGPTGVELAGAMAEMRKHILPLDYPAIDFDRMNIYLVEGMDRVLPPMSRAASQKAKVYLEKMGVIIKLNTLVESYDGETVRFKSGEEILTRTLVWAAGVTGVILKGLPAESIEKGRVLVNQYNEVKGLKNVFALGDIALMKSDKYPKGHPGVAQPAIQQGKHLAKNLQRLLRNIPLKPFKYFDKGTLAIVGRSRAVVDFPGNIHLGGLFAWIIWVFVHLFSLIGFRNKLVVMSNWIYRFFTYQRGNRLIIRPFVQADDKAGKDFISLYQED
jgi:NADH dehydrogenase